MLTSNRKLLFICLTIALTGAANSKLQADPNTVTGQLKLMATLEGKPAFRTTTWNIKCQQSAKQYQNTITRHTVVLDLAPGECTISVTLGETTQTRHIDIKENKIQSITVSLD